MTIALDAMPFIGWQFPVLNQLDSLDWHWVIAEGAAMNSGSTSWCKPQLPRLSRDGTSKLLASFRGHPRITVLQRQQWGSKDEMVNACVAEIKEPCVLLQVDADEMWNANQLFKIAGLFDLTGSRNVAHFYARYFVGPNLVVSHESDRKNNIWIRAWQFTPGMTFERHEPPVLRGASKVITRDETEQLGLVFDHFAYVFPDQLQYKERFYGYKNALACWYRLQRNDKWPARLKDFLPWANPESMVEKLYL